MTFDVIGISETKEQVGKGFLTNVNLKGYAFCSQPSNSSAGGAGLYIGANLNYSIREDLNILEDEFECIWVEIKNAKSPNILCCCVYRHPNIDSRKFTEYMDMTMNKLSKENKLIFVMGDFNLNLLNCESHSETNDFLNCMVSHYLLPYILHPTRVTDHSATVIDNIFCNNTAYDTFIVEIFYVKSLTIFPSLFLINLTLIIRHFPMQNGTIPNLMNRNLFLTSVVTVWYFG